MDNNNTMEYRIGLEKQNKRNDQVTELILDNCRASQISGLTDEFVNLETLSLINVGLVTLKGFPKLPKLKKLELSDNRLTGGLNLLQGSPKLQHLNISGNRIKDLEALEPLKEFHDLVNLDLFNCEVTKVDDYRIKVFNLLPNLNSLDGYDRNEQEVDNTDDSEEESSDVENRITRDDNNLGDGEGEDESDLDEDDDSYNEEDDDDEDEEYGNNYEEDVDDEDQVGDEEDVEHAGPDSEEPTRDEGDDDDGEDESEDIEQAGVDSEEPTRDDGEDEDVDNDDQDAEHAIADSEEPTRDGGDEEDGNIEGADGLKGDELDQAQEMKPEEDGNADVQPITGELDSDKRGQKRKHEDEAGDEPGDD